jgi:hypothetical protein
LRNIFNSRIKLIARAANSLSERLLRRGESWNAKNGIAPARPGDEMNALEQPLRQSHEKLMVEAPRIARAASRSAGQVFTQSARRKPGEFLGLAFVTSLSAIVLLVHFLRSRMGELPLRRQESEGLSVVACALGYIGVFLWRLSRAFERDAQQVEPLKALRNVEREMNQGK